MRKHPIANSEKHEIDDDQKPHTCPYIAIRNTGKTKTKAVDHIKEWVDRANELPFSGNDCNEKKVPDRKVAGIIMKF